MSSRRMLGTYIPTLVTAFVGFLMIAEYVLNIPVLKDTASQIKNWGVIVGGFAIGLAVINLTMQHGKRIYRRTEGLWIPSIILLISMYSMIVFGIPTIVGQESVGFNFGYQYLQAPLVITTKSLLAFFITSAAFRAFRARSFEAALMLASAFCVMFFMVPLGAFMGPVPYIGEWLRDIIMSATFRTLQIGATVGLVSLGIRTIIGRGGGLSRLLRPEETGE